MPTTLAFDVYGTLIDTSGVVTSLEKFAGDRAVEFSGLWREKQLEYSFRRGLMQNYVDFPTLTRHALDYVCGVLDMDISPKEKDDLMDGYKSLPPFPEANSALDKLKSAGHRLFAFSNGPEKDLLPLLQNAGLSVYFLNIVSTDEIKSYKPNPAVYAHFLRRSGSTGSDAWMISGNPFDVIGALSAGMRSAWIKRSEKMVFDPWEFQPTLTVPTLTDLPEALNRFEL